MQNYKIRPVDRLNMFVNFNGEVYVNSDKDNPFDSEIVFMFDPNLYFFNLFEDETVEYLNNRLIELGESTTYNVKICLTIDVGEYLEQSKEDAILYAKSYVAVKHFENPNRFKYIYGFYDDKENEDISSKLLWELEKCIKLPTSLESPNKTTLMQWCVLLCNLAKDCNCTEFELSSKECLSDITSIIDIYDRKQTRNQEFLAYAIKNVLASRITIL